ncbi:MAG: hypothetical protein QOG52_1994 [Frankiaceae bacterium]|jgi:hypothetical protein|nr:hypothetical protein [Frankiaceae bacterium]
MSSWVIVTGYDNFGRTAERGFTVQGVKSRQRRKAEAFRPGDTALYYVTGVKAFAGAVTIQSESWEDHELIWTSKPGEDYPWRFEIAPRIVLTDEADWIPAISLIDQVEYCQKWPREHWTLAFQGNVHSWSDTDAAVVLDALAATADTATGKVLRSA